MFWCRLSEQKCARCESVMSEDSLTRATAIGFEPTPAAIIRAASVRKKASLSSVRPTSPRSFISLMSGMSYDAFSSTSCRISPWAFTFLKKYMYLTVLLDSRDRPIPLTNVLGTVPSV